MTDFTPGPWTITGRKERDWLYAKIVSEGAGIMVAEVRGATFIDGDEHPEHVANARLIAAAPDLLEALAGLKWKSADKDNMEFSCTVTTWQLDKLRAAIANAKGVPSGESSP